MLVACHFFSNATSVRQDAGGVQKYLNATIKRNGGIRYTWNTTTKWDTWSNFVVVFGVHQTRPFAYPASRPPTHTLLTPGLLTPRSSPSLPDPFASHAAAASPRSTSTRASMRTLSSNLFSLIRA
jgi:hypothetical protein